jgi:hypothetical protein
LKLRQLVGRLRPSVWSGWPDRAYQRNRYQQRLSAVQQHLIECLETAPRDSLRILSLCAGDGRDVVSVLRSHPRRTNVSAWLVEIDRRSVAIGMQNVESAGLVDSVRFLNEDATDYATYANIPPSHITLACGVWGHVPTQERASFVHAIACLCQPGGSVIWTRGVSKGMDRLHQILSHFTPACWEEVRVSLTPDKGFAVATHRYCGPLIERPTGGRIFNFERAAGH